VFILRYTPSIGIGIAFGICQLPTRAFFRP
jgi:hypothetical protein